ncbi:hypothetical protein [Aestuariispira ectoiniformans]|uniref:hypothetical protein n=1 Tax=Aestuariispira ectoiniformans TaxID=2775080 RepID=UPI00223BCE3B|nr:hypothetical protein [Aestuariispira ectoiniformans]
MSLRLLSFAAAVMVGFFVLSANATAGAEQEMDTNYIFGVRWEVNGMPYLVSMNGMPLTVNGGYPNVDTRLPASQFVAAGTNRLALSSWMQSYKEEHELAVSMLYWEPGWNPNTEAKTAFRVVVHPGQDDREPAIEYEEGNPESPLQPVVDSARWVVHKDYDELVVSFENRQATPEWCWQKGEVLKDDKATRDSLTKAYRNIHDLLEAGDNDRLMDDWWATMVRENAEAYGEPEGYVRHRAGFQVFMGKPDVFQLAPFPVEPMKLNLAADNRVAWLTTKGVTKPLKFNHVQEEDVSSQIQSFFIRRDGEWVVCR